MSMPTADPPPERTVQGFPWTSRAELAAALENRTVAELCEDWGVSDSTIYRWRRRHGLDGGQ